MKEALKLKLTSCVLVILLSSAAAMARGASEYVATKYSQEDFKLDLGNFDSDIYVGSEETPAVLRCANDL